MAVRVASQVEETTHSVTQSEPRSMMKLLSNGASKITDTHWALPEDITYI